MKTEALKRFRDRLARDESVHGLWVTFASANVTEMAVSIGLDWVVVDARHGSLDWTDIVEHVQAGLRSDTVILVRLAERSTSLTKHALDTGADGVVIPGVETVEQLEESVRDCRYPAEGHRESGGQRETPRGPCFADHTAQANTSVLVVPLIESVAAIPNVPAMCNVDGVDAFFFAAADSSATAGFRDHWEGPGMAEQIRELRNTINSAGKRCGLVAGNIENLVECRNQGFRMLGLGSDSGLLLGSLHQSLQALNHDRLPVTMRSSGPSPRDISMSHARSPAVAEHPLPHLNVLLVEDNVMNQKFATRMLKKMGHAVEIVDNGSKSLEATESGQFDVVLMDVEMPVMDGLTATAIIREREKCSGQRIPIIAMTAGEMQGDREKCLAAGMDQYICKPVKSSELVAALRSVLTPNAGQHTPDRSDSPGRTSVNSIFDPTALLNRIDGDIEFLHETIDIFLRGSETMLLEMRESLRIRDSATLRRTAHTLKSNVGSFFAQAAAESALRLEQIAADEKLDEATDALTELEEHVRQLQAALRQHKTELNPAQ